MGASLYTIGTSGRLGRRCRPSSTDSRSHGRLEPNERWSYRNTHTDAGGQCADAIEAGVHADGPARILHTGIRIGDLGRAKSKTGIPT